MNLPLPLPQILLFLKVRNALRLIVIAGFYGCAALALGRLMWADAPAVQARSYLVVMVILGLAAITGGYLLRIGRCPRCGHVFAVRTGARGRNNFTSACLNCGLRLDGSNAADYPAASTNEAGEEA
jgi:hypothetical protein